MSLYSIVPDGIYVSAGNALPLMEYKDGKPTDVQRVNGEGLPMYRIPLLHKGADEEGYEKCNIEVATAKAPEHLPDFTPVVIEGLKLRVTTWTDGQGKTHVSEKLSARTVKKA